MGFWVYMVFIAMLIPAVMIGFGRYFMKGGPKHINAVFGYRTARSKKNQETWAFAHRYCGRLWFFGGLLLAPFSVLPFCFYVGREIPTVGWVGGLVCMVQLVLLLLTVGMTEWRLHRVFDKNGVRR